MYNRPYSVDTTTAHACHTRMHIHMCMGISFSFGYSSNTIQSALFNCVCLNVLCIITSAICMDFGSRSTMTWDTTLNNSEFVKQVLLTSVKPYLYWETQHCRAAELQYTHNTCMRVYISGIVDHPYTTSCQCDRLQWKSTTENGTQQNYLAYRL